MNVYPATTDTKGKQIADLDAEPMTAEFWAEGPAPHTVWMFVGGADRPSLVNVKVASKAFVADVDTTMISLPHGKRSVTAAGDMVRSAMQAGPMHTSCYSWADAKALIRRRATITGTKYRALAATGVRVESTDADQLELFGRAW